MNKVCVIGWPINHSRSPLIHNYWIRSHGLDAIYERRPVAHEHLKTFLLTLKEQGYLGCNVTIPHKEAAISFIAQPDKKVQRIGALNTVFFRNDKSCATSTDGEGFFQNVIANNPELRLKDRIITILGAGGAARAIVDRLLEEHPQSIKVLNRNIDRAQHLAKDFGTTVHAYGPETLSSLLPSTDLLVNTTSLGMTGHDPLEIDLRLLPKSAIVADIVYVPLKTKLISDAEALGLRSVPGLGMLLHQAVPGFELWFGTKPIVTDELYDLVASDIDPGYRR